MTEENEVVTEPAATEPVSLEPTPEVDSVLVQLVGVVGKENASDTELERIVYSGDPSSLPQFHYRWKQRYLADYVVRVQTIEEVKGVIGVARNHGIPVIPRGGASSCLGSSSPSRGGISLDLKKMNKVLEVDQAKGMVRVEPGVTFTALDVELGKHGMELGIYPSSAKSAVIGGWIGCGGKAGIGTPCNGTLLDNLVSLKVILPDGSETTIEGANLDLYNGSYGILGVIVEATLAIRRKPASIKTLSYGFSRLEHVCNTMVRVTQLEQKPIYLKIADFDFQSYSNPLEKGKYVLSVTYPEETQSAPVTDIEQAVAESGGTYLGDSYGTKEWDLRYDCEFNPKEHCDTLMFQELWVDVENVYDILKAYEKHKKSHKVPSIWFGMLGTSSMMRLELMAMLNPDKYLEFIASKGILHKMVKRAIKQGGGPYTIGLQNSIYMKKAYPERQSRLKELKKSADPSGIMNPDRVTSCMTSYGRMNILFVMAAAFRRLGKYVAR
ncbi:MAG: FAD-binding oxidoreductase [Candidatus Thorarchaeota archaeon]|nr:FAD-binding oxidoreductase [Candidatus Thorarchaeota archaeon]MCK5238234.1 FAD-binding oxidoreductase [Candidatus Thorarchaeota archaeon]